jgi:hypothetical protein
MIDEEEEFDFDCDTCGARECEDCPVDEFRADSLKRLDDFEKGLLEDGGISEEDKTFFRNLPQEERRRRIRKIIYAPDRSEASKKSWQTRRAGITDETSRGEKKKYFSEKH